MTVKSIRNKNKPRGPRTSASQQFSVVVARRREGYLGHNDIATPSQIALDVSNLPHSLGEHAFVRDAREIHVVGIGE